MSEVYSVRNNVTAMYAHRQSMLNNGTLNKSLERLSSGYRVNRSADDVAGLAVSEKLRTQIRGYHRAAINIQDGVSFLQTADAATQNVHDILQRMRELSVQAANGVYSDTDRSLIQQEIDELLEEINRIHTSAEFNRQRIFNYRAADIVWLVDGTITMGDNQAAIIAEAQNFVNALVGSKIDYRVGVVKFGYAAGDGELPVAQGSMTTDVATFQANVTAVGVAGSAEEDGMEALNSSLTAFQYRQEAKKIFIIVTDEDSDDGIDDGGVTSANLHADITAATRQNMVANEALVYVVGEAGTHSVLEQAYSGTPGSQGVPAATGGTLFTSLTTGFSSQVAASVDAAIGERLTLHVGANEAQTFDSAMQSPINQASLGIANNVYVTSQQLAESSITLIDGAIDKVTRLRSSIGSEINRLEFTLDYARVVEEAEQSAESRIRDTDMAAEIIDFTKSQVISQSANAMLAQANLLPQNVLSLLG